MGQVGNLSHSVRTMERPVMESRYRWWVGPVWYVALLGVTVGYLTVNFKLHRADLTAPLCPPRNDSAALLSLVTSVREAGVPWRVERLGAPGTAERTDYPLPEHTHYLTLRLLFRVTDNPFLVFNLWCLLSYPLTAVCAFAVFRAVGVSRPIGFALAVVYTFLPYHAGRVFSHTMLAHYQTVPLMLVPVLWIVSGRLPFFGPADEHGRRRLSVFNGTTLWTVLLTAVVAATSPYYAFFGCFFLLVAGLYRGLSEASWRPALAGLGTAGLVCAAGFACTLPFVLAQRGQGANPAVAQRHPNEADVYCLKVTELVLPFGGHRVGAIGHVTRLYNAEGIHINENKDSVLGTIGAIGFLILLGRLLMARGGPGLLGGLAVLNVAAVVLGASGGLGGLFNFLVFPQIRCYNRVCVFIAFWCLLAVALLVDRWAARGSGRRAWLAAAGLLVFGLWDITSHRQAPKHAELQQAHAAWAGFVERMEASLPAGGMVFQLPAASYPEAGPVERMPDYAHLACHSYSRTLRWSYGTNRNRRWDAWHQHVAGLPTGEMIRALCLADFAGVYVDRRGYADNGEAVIADLRQRLGPELVTSDTGDQLLFSLAVAAQQLRSTVDPPMLAAEREHLLTRPCLLCQDGFLRWAPADPPEPWRATHTAVMRLLNPGTEARRVGVAMNWRRQGASGTSVVVSGETLGIRQTATPPDEPGPFRLEFDLPPGEHLLRFEAAPRPIGLARMHVAWTATDVRLLIRDEAGDGP